MESIPYCSDLICISPALKMSTSTAVVIYEWAPLITNSRRFGHTPFILSMEKTGVVVASHRIGDSIA